MARGHCRTTTTPQEEYVHLRQRHAHLLLRGIALVFLPLPGGWSCPAGGSGVCCKGVLVHDSWFRCVGGTKWYCLQAFSRALTLSGFWHAPHSFETFWPARLAVLCLKSTRYPWQELLSVGQWQNVPLCLCLLESACGSTVAAAGICLKLCVTFTPFAQPASHTYGMHVCVYMTEMVVPWKHKHALLHV